MPTQISPVNAPKLFSLTFCAPSRMFLVARIALDTDSRAVNGGQTTMSTSFTWPTSSVRSLIKVSASATVLFIFQLPAMINLRSLFISKKCNSESLFTDRRTGQLFPGQSRHARQHGAFAKFQAGPASRTHKRDLVGQS